MEPIRILFLAANPIDTPQIRIAEEVRVINERLRATELGSHFELEQYWAVRVVDLSDALLRYRPQVVHFSGHGSSKGQIILEDASGMAQPVPAKALSDLFEILADNVQCVVLNACYSDDQASGIARHINCVVGMSHAVPDSTAIAFAAGFYRGLGWGRSVDTSYRLGVNEIDLSNLKDADKPQLISKPGVDARNIYLLKPDLATQGTHTPVVVTRKTPFRISHNGIGGTSYSNLSLFLLLGFFILVADRIATSWGIVVDRVSFIIGIVVAAVTSLVVFQLDSWWSSFNRDPRASITRSYTQDQDKRAALGALFKLIFIAVVIITVAYLILRPSP